MGLDSCHAALRTNPNLVQAIGVRGWFEALLGGDLERGMKSVEHARQLDPEFSRTYVYLSWIRRAQGAPEAALECTAKAVELDPHALLNRHAHAFSHFLAGNSAEALKHERWILENHPKDDIAQGYSSIFLASIGQQKAALDSAYRALDLARHTPATWGAMAWCLAVCGESEEALRLVEEAYAAKLPRCPRPMIAPAMVALGKHEQALRLLHEAREEQCPWFPGARLDPRLALLQDDKRWHSLYS
jgi:tetratricopeptide (TPR) repeat protein